MQQAYWSIFGARVENPEPLAQRLQMNREERVQLEQGRRIFQAMPALATLERPSEIVRHLDGLTDASLVAGIAMSETAAARENIIKYLVTWRNIEVKITGKDLIAMGLKPSPEFGKLLTRLRQAWLDGQITDTTEERKVLEAWLSRGDSHDGN
jgi:tRNA nucleotidyltransferase (CCA-adding enzyme)